MPLRIDALTRLWRIVCAAMIPINVLMVVWLLPARFVLGVGGWNTVIFAVSCLPVVVIALTATTVLARVGQPQPIVSPLVAAIATLSQITVWAALITVGVGLVDVDDPSTSRMEPEKSLLISLAGWSEHTLALSNRVANTSFFIALGAWGILLITLLYARSRARRPGYHSTP